MWVQPQNGCARNHDGVFLEAVQQLVPTTVATASAELPATIRNESELEEILTRPSAALIEAIKTISSPLLVLGAGGKMGPTLAVLARRAAEAAGHPLEVVAVSRFGNASSRQWLEARGVQTASCDLLDANAIIRLPDAANIIYLVGLKFGTAQNPAATWAINTLVPARVCERYPRSRIVALSTGNVYPPSAVSRGGAVETDSLTPLGEYANAAVGRERIFEYHAHRQHTPVTLLRLFYAVELRYGVLADIARKVHTGQPVALANGAFNCIWQRDANDLILRALPLTAAPARVYNLCRPEVFSVREIATRLGELLGRPPVFSGSETTTALLGNSAQLGTALDTTATPMETILHWTAQWVKHGGRDLGRPTHFEVRDGKY
ncbi:MAG: NAD(P)-dependent oxidoreductase [Verrucomicrobia subdivision 3 bacterium]|nr:NAD(P)-dependent oxidoreductase [Verrucomicrobiota bacterium]MCC6821973.1 NAD(P)-dependent oxidoreductase [Limisphaerales bacterium]